MPNIQRTIQTTGNNRGTKVLLVRQPVKSVRKSDEADRLPVRLAIGVISGLGVVAVVWLMGFIGFRLGFASALGLPDLHSEPGGGLATGAMILMNLPMRIFEAGKAEPLWLMLAFALIAIPGGGLSGVRNPTPGGPRPSKLFLLFTWTGSVTACLSALVLAAWVVAPLRSTWISPLPDNLAAIDEWIRHVSIVAGLDGLMAMTGALWVVLAMRLRVPRWMKGLSVSMIIVALTMVLVATACSNATAAHLHIQRSQLEMIADADSPQMIIGSTDRHVVVLQTVDQRIVLSMIDHATEGKLVGRQSIAEMLLARLPDDEF